MNRFVIVLMLIPLTLFLEACFSQPYPEKNLYLLTTPVVENKAKSGKQRTLLIGIISTAAGYDNQGLVYRVGPNKYEQDFYNDFMAPPARLIVDNVTQYLDAANPRLLVVKTPGLFLADYGLEGYLESMYGDFTVTPPLAVINIRFSLVDLRPQNPIVKFDHTYRRKILFEGKGAAGLVSAFNVGLGEILLDLNKDIGKAVR